MNETNLKRGINYDVENCYSPDFAHLVCNFLSDKKRKFTYKEIMDFLQISDNERSIFKVYIDELVNGRINKDVTSMYNLSFPLCDNSY